MRNGIAKTRTSPFRPQGNGQCERINGSIQKALQLALRTCNLDKTKWEVVLSVALSSLRSLQCTVTNCIRYDHIFAFQRSSVVGSNLPEYLLRPDRDVLHQQPISLKGDASTEKVKLLETISPYFARIKFLSERIDMVSKRTPAPYQQASTFPVEAKVEDGCRDASSLETFTQSEEPSRDPLSDSADDPDVTPAPDSPTVSSSQGYVTRFGRSVKAPQRYQS